MFLRDVEIEQLIAGGYIQGVRQDTLVDGRHSPIQPCSLDLTIGSIFVPGCATNVLGGAGNPRSTHSLGVGETVVVETRESFKLPGNVGAFGFPPTTVSKVGVLVTNLGHIDPGYDGTIKFTLVNMGRKGYSLRAGDNIYTTLFFKLRAPARADYRERNPPSPTPSATPMAELLDSLPPDFLEVSARARNAAQTAVTDELRAPYRAALFGAATAVLTLGINIWLTIDRTSEVKEDLQQHRETIDRQLAIEATAQAARDSVDRNREAIELLKAQVEDLATKLSADRK